MCALVRRGRHVSKEERMSAEPRGGDMVREGVFRRRWMGKGGSVCVKLSVESGRIR